MSANYLIFAFINYQNKNSLNSINAPNANKNHPKAGFSLALSTFFDEKKPKITPIQQIDVNNNKKFQSIL